MPEIKGKERWAAVPGYVGLYEVSDGGRVRSLTFRGVPRSAPLLMRPQPLKTKGYLRVPLGRPGDPKRKHYLSHLVLAAFGFSRPDGHEARHLDDDHTNNRLSNLEWGTHRENMQDAIRNGRTQQGARHHAAKLASPARVFALHRRGLLHREIAARVGLSTSQVSRILTGRRWKHAERQAS